MFLDKISENITQFRQRVILAVLLFLIVATSFFSGEWNQWLVSIFLILTFPLIFFSLLLVSPFEAKKILTKKIFSSPHFYLVIFLIVALASSLFSSYIYDSLNQFSLVLSYIIIFWITAFIVKGFARLRIFSLVIFFTGLLVSLINLLLFIADTFSRAGGLLLNANALGSYLLFSVPLGLVLFLESEGKKQKILYGISTFIVVVSFLLTFSYTGWMSFLLPLVLITAIYRRKIFNKKNILAILAIILILLIMGIGFRYEKTKDWGEAWKLYKVITFESVKFSFSQRLKFNIASLAIFKDNPLIGTGLSSYQQVYPRYAQTLYEQPRYVHNYYLQTAAELGIFGLLSFLGFVVLLLNKVYKIIKNRQPGPAANQYLLGLGLGILGSTIHAIFDFGWQFPAVFLLFWLSAGILMGYRENATEGAVSNHIDKKNYFSIFFKTVIFLVAIILLLRGFTLFLANYYFQKAEIAINENESEQAGIYYKNGLRYDPSPEQFRNFAWNEFVLAHADKDYSDAEQYINQSLKWNKADYFAYRILGRIYFAQKIYDQAEVNYQKAIFYDPVFHPDFYYDLGVLYQAQKKYDRAISVLDHISQKYEGITSTTNIYLSQQISGINNLLDQIYSAKGEKDKAVK